MSFQLIYIYRERERERERERVKKIDIAEKFKNQLIFVSSYVVILVVYLINSFLEQIVK